VGRKTYYSIRFHHTNWHLVVARGAREDSFVENIPSQLHHFVKYGDSFLASDEG
jgi:hypothetical protein